MPLTELDHAANAASRLPLPAPAERIEDAFLRLAETQPHCIALECGREFALQWTYGALRDWVLHVASQLIHDRGVAGVLCDGARSSSGRRFSLVTNSDCNTFRLHSFLLQSLKLPKPVSILLLTSKNSDSPSYLMVRRSFGLQSDGNMRSLT